MMTSLVLFLLALAGASASNYGRQHTVTATITNTHTIRVTVTRDVTVTQTTVVDVPITQYVTLPRFVPEDEQTVTSLVTITSTPVEIKTAVIGANPVRSLFSTYTTFVTDTATVQLVNTVTHYRTTHEVNTVPVIITKNIQQDVIVTSSQVITVTSTQTTGGYY